ncbi:hypothetical protein DFR86_01185 [Acidianus sulfidivorans JP7]|uniref:Uncharacterized protein n=1 Tax=Acidianus sulfidivorans JP7 TaxID=619593 RepID=A0A2U9IJU5_9CREN|nr:hypothetical protein [Acidianus sulfidivorans]AWR96290.1 hypothetical protein DFR86_01185 [Acidianus sulfidivorans JP7]
MISKFLFITKDKKFYYNGKKIKEIKNLDDLSGVKIIFARPMIVYDVDKIGLAYFEENFGNLVVGDYTVEKLIDIVLSYNFILYVDHENRKIYLISEGNGIIQLNYSALDFLRYFFAKTKGILLESANFDLLTA